MLYFDFEDLDGSSEFLRRRRPSRDWFVVTSESMNYLPEDDHAMGGSDSIAELETGAFRPGTSDLFFKDFVWALFVVTAATLWVLALVVLPMMDDGTTEMADAASILSVAAAVDSALVVGVIYWRYGRAKALAERGVVTKARIAKVAGIGDSLRVVYEFHVEGKAYTGSMGGGPFAARWELEALIGKDITLLVDPQKPKVHLMLSKLGKEVPP